MRIEAVRARLAGLGTTEVQSAHAVSSSISKALKAVLTVHIYVNVVCVCVCVFMCVCARVCFFCVVRFRGTVPRNFEGVCADIWQPLSCYCVDAYGFMHIIIIPLTYVAG